MAERFHTGKTPLEVPFHIIFFIIHSGFFARKCVKNIHWAFTKAGVYVFNCSPQLHWITVVIKESGGIWLNFLRSQNKGENFLK